MIAIATGKRDEWHLLPHDRRVVQRAREGHRVRARLGGNVDVCRAKHSERKEKTVGPPFPRGKPDKKYKKNTKNYKKQQLASCS
jgi:hypothetical protein